MGSSSARWRTARAPPRGSTLITATSAASRRATLSGSSARRIDSSAARGTSCLRRSHARSSTAMQGCSTYSKPPTAWAARFRRTIHVRAVSLSQAPLASTRTFAGEPCNSTKASATASTRWQSRSRSERASATLTFAVAQPGLSNTRLRASSAEITGIVTLSGTFSRRGLGAATRAASNALASQVEDSRGS